MQLNLKVSSSRNQVMPMVHVIFWLPFLFVVFLLEQSNAVSDQCGELQSEISSIRKLNHRNELLLDQCYEQLKTETHVSEAAFRSLKLAEDETKSNLQRIDESEAVKSDLNKQLDELKNELKDLQKQLEDNKEVLKTKNAIIFNQTVQILSCEKKPFYIQSVHSGKYLDVRGNSKNKGAQVIIYDFHGDKNQQWTYKKGMIISKLSGLALDVSGGKVNGEIIMWPENGGDNQKWYFDDDLTIRSELGFVLDVKHASRENSSILVAYTKEGLDNQKFRIVPVEKQVTNTGNAVKINP